MYIFKLACKDFNKAKLNTQTAHIPPHILNFDSCIKVQFWKAKTQLAGFLFAQFSFYKLSLTDL